MHDFWQQQGSEPLFPDLVWARPENRAYAGRLLLVGGTAQGFAGVAEAYAAAERAGVGVCCTVLPDALSRTVGRLFPEAQFAPSTPSGSLAVSALAELLEAAAWAEGICVAGDTGNNSETTRLLETFLGKHHGSTILCGDSVDTLLPNPSAVLDRAETALVLSFDQLQKLATAARHPEAFTSDMALLQFVERLHGFAQAHAAHLVVIWGDTVAVAAEGQVSTTAVKATVNPLAATVATWWLQNPTKPYAALTTAVLAE